MSSRHLSAKRARWPSPVVPRLLLDLGATDLAAALWAFAARAERALERVETSWSPRGDSFACLSVRSGWDALLGALAFPAGSEVLASAINIRDMARIAEAHDLRVVPVDVDYDTLAPPLGELSRLVTPRTRVILIAHLFGSRLDLTPYAEFAARHDILLVEDAAQGFTGVLDEGHSGALATLTSFGPIKTASALGGAVLTVRDPWVLQRMRAIQASWPRQASRGFLARVLRYGALRLLSERRIYGLFLWLLALLDCDHDQLLKRFTRSVVPAELFAYIRQQPCAAQLGLVEHRLRHYDPTRVRDRARAGAELLAGLSPSTVDAPGRHAPSHSYWVMPVNPDDPDRLAACLLRAGFDATPGTSSMVVLPATEGRQCPGAQRILHHVIYLPIQPGLTGAELERLRDAICASASSKGAGGAPPLPRRKLGIAMGRPSGVGG